MSGLVRPRRVRSGRVLCGHSGAQEAHRRVADRGGRRRLGVWPRAGCTPTGISLVRKMLEKGGVALETAASAWSDRFGRRGTAHAHAHLREERAGAPGRGSAREGHGARHRRRHRRQPVAGDPRGDVGACWTRGSWTVPPVFGLCRSSVASRGRRCSWPSTWGWASCWSCPSDAARQASDLLTAAGEEVIAGRRDDQTGAERVVLEGLG